MRLIADLPDFSFALIQVELQAVQIGAPAQAGLGEMHLLNSGPSMRTLPLMLNLKVGELSRRLTPA